MRSEGPRAPCGGVWMQLDGLKILLAERSPGARRAARGVLESLGAVVSAVEDGAQALELAATERFDVLLLDIEMPGVPGLDLIRGVKAASPGGAGPTVIALAASGGEGRRAEIEAAGAAGVLSKPLASREHLGRHIRMLIQRAPRGAAPPDAAPEARPAEIDGAVYAALARAVGPPALADFLATVDEDVRAADEELVAAARADDMAGVRRATHVLIGVAGAVGAVGLQRLAERLNQAARRADAAELGRLAGAARAEGARLRAFLAVERQRAGP